MKLSTPLSQTLGLKYPLVCAPMFIISNKEMIVACAEAGILGTMPSLNARTPEQFRADLAWIRERTDKPFGINLTLGLTPPPRIEADFQACVEHEVPDHALERTTLAPNGGVDQLSRRPIPAPLRHGPGTPGTESRERQEEERSGQGAFPIHGELLSFRVDASG